MASCVVAHLRVVEDGHTFLHASWFCRYAWLISLGLELFLFLPHHKEALRLGISNRGREGSDNLIWGRKTDLDTTVLHNSVSYSIITAYNHTSLCLVGGCWDSHTLGWGQGSGNTRLFSAAGLNGTSWG